MLSDRLQKYSNASCTSATYATPDTKSHLEVARVARVQVATPDKTDSVASDEFVSNWWLIHFTDRDPVEVAIWPPCDHSIALLSYPEAIAAEPIPSPIPLEVMTDE
jgi:hypothetical protein